MFFTVEETNLMCCFDTSSRKRLIAEMKSLPINELDDEMAELLFHTVRKLEGITDEALLKEAQKAIHTGDRTKKRRHLYLYGAVWAAGGALLTGLTWLITVLF